MRSTRRKVQGETTHTTVHFERTTTYEAERLSGASAKLRIGSLRPAGQGAFRPKVAVDITLLRVVDYSLADTKAVFSNKWFGVFVHCYAYKESMIMMHERSCHRVLR